MMKIKKLLFFIGALSGLMAANTGVAEPVGSTAMIKTAKIICTGSLTGDVPLVTVVGAGQQKGIETSWLITNTSTTDSLAITKIDSYGMDGKLIVSLTPDTAPTLEADTGGFFKWTVSPLQLIRFPHDYSMIYPVDGVGGTDPSLVQWYNVVFTVQNATPDAAISAPVALAAMVERTEDLAAVPPTHFVLSRTRNECKYMM